MSIEPTQAQLERLAASDEPGPVIMINLLRFKDRADGIDAGDEIRGVEAYGRYAEEVQPFLDHVGGAVLLVAQPTESVIGPDAAEWDMVLAVRYPSRRAFLEMVSDPAYLEIHAHRDAALADSRLIACRSLPG